MAVHLIREIDRLKKMILGLCAMVEENCVKAVRSLTDRDEALAHDVCEADLEIDRMEVEVEEECLKILALHQPVAIDLRYVVSTMKINNDLERIGDLTVSFAHKAIALAGKEPIPIPDELQVMADKVQIMIRQCLDALVNMDGELARSVCAADDEVDALKDAIKSRVIPQLPTMEAGKIDLYLRILGATRNLERMGDHATNIAEDVIYLVEGEIVRHMATEDG